LIEELLAIADNEGLTGKEAYRPRPIHWIIDLDPEGNLIGLTPTTGQTVSKTNKLSERSGKHFEAPVNYHTQIKDNKIHSVCTNQHNWLPDFLTGPASELFFDCKGLETHRDKKKPKLNPAKQKAFHALIAESLEDDKLSGNEGMRSIGKFLDSEPKFPSWLLTVADGKRRDALLKRFADDEEIISFRVNCKVTFQDTQVKRWWTEQIELRRAAVLKKLPEGRDFYDLLAGRLAEYFPSVFGNIPFSSFDKQPFESYGLGKQTTSFRIETAEKAAAALNWLLAPENGCRLGLGDLVAIFWARAGGQTRSTGFAELMAAADPLQVRDFISGIWGGQFRVVEQADFYAGLLSTSPGRFSVRSWHTETLPEAEENLRWYFRAISLPRLNDPYQSPFAIPALASATVQKSKKSRPQPGVYIALFEAALFGMRLPYRLLVAALIRQRVELAKGADKQSQNEFNERLAARTAIVKLYFAQRIKGDLMINEDFELENEPAYVCGRLLALLDKIHVEAHRDSGGTNTSPANRVYGAASTTPALIFPQVMKLARVHLNKIKNKGRAHNLEYGIPKKNRADGVAEDFEGLAAICSRLQATSTQGFPRTLGLEDQGRFAIGFYYERCRQWPPTRGDDKQVVQQREPETEPNPANTDDQPQRRNQ
jgi:CRISPR-associated protein Csd1